ncbi:MAG: type I-U CRISPR-associated protein Csb2 [Bacillota bacterium]
MSYLGRAESWVEAELLEDWVGETNCFPVEDAVPEGWERVSLLAVQGPDEYRAWVGRLEPAAWGAAGGGGRRGLGAAVGDLVPPDLWTALHAETGTLQRQGWSLPPGSCWVDYARPADAFRVTYRGHSYRLLDATHPTVARFALAGTVLPRLTEAVALGERMRQAVMAHARGVEGGAEALTLFSGRTPDGKPLDDDHAHAFFLPADDDGDGRIDHLTIYVPAGLPPVAQAVLGRLRKLWGAGGHDIFVVLVGMGQPEDYGGFNVAGGQTPQMAASRVWVSRTPYLLTRHPKTHRDGRRKVGPDGLQLDGPEAQLRAELARRGFPAPVLVATVRGAVLGGKEVRWLAFRRERLQGGGRLASPVGYGFRVEFPKPVRGPIALGYGCHFGLGQFVAEPG